MSDGVERMQAAAFAALGRLHAVLWQFDEAALFAPLGETLTWTMSIAEASEMLQEPLYSGLGYARGRVLHGECVAVTVVAERPAASVRPLVSDSAGPRGEEAPRIWVFRPDSELSRVTPYGVPTGSLQRVHYQRHIEGRALAPLVDRALHLLGVDTWAAAHQPLGSQSG